MANFNPDPDPLLENPEPIDEVADRVLIAGFGLAAPLLRLREAQLQREIARVAAKKGDDHPDVIAQRDFLQHSTRQRATLEEELSRTRIDKPTLADEQNAGIWGRIADDGQPVSDATVVAFADGRRVDFRCTGENGEFAMEIPSGSELVLSVRSADGAELFRDPTAISLQPGELRFREIDLTRAPAVVCLEPDSDSPLDTFPMADLVGQPEAIAMAFIRDQRLNLAERSEDVVDDQNVGIVRSQEPPAGTDVSAGTNVSIVVGASNNVRVPSVIGQLQEEAQQLLETADLAAEIQTVSTTSENAGRVVNQIPGGGEFLARGQPVTLVIGVFIDVDTTIPLDQIASRVEDRIRAVGIGVNQPTGFVLTQLEGAGVTNVSELEQFFEDAQENDIRDQFGFSNRTEARALIFAIRRQLEPEIPD